MSASLSKAERSYIQAGLVTSPPSRADGRALFDYRPIVLETGVAPLANGSARLCIGRTPGRGRGGGTEVFAATKLEVENVGDGSPDGGVDGGRIVCSVTCSPSAYPHHSSNQLEDLQHDLSSLLHTTLSHPSLHPPNLAIIPGKKSWLLGLDLLVLAADAGNVTDALFMAARAALWDTRVPRTRPVEYRAPGSATTVKKSKGKGKQKRDSNLDGDVDMEAEDLSSGFDTRRQIRTATDFELPDYWDEGEVLGGRDKWPICVTLNIEHPTHYLDASAQEEAATALRLLLMFSFTSNSNEPAAVRAMRLLGAGEIKMDKLKELVKIGETYARDMFDSLNTRLNEEDIRRNQKARERFEQHRL